MDHVTTYSMSHKWRARADAFLSTLSWDHTWSAMNQLILDVIDKRKEAVRPEAVRAASPVAIEAV